MNKEEIMARFAARKCENQVEFDELMHAINNQQSIENHPYLDRLREINKQKALIGVQIDALKQQKKALTVEAIDIEQKQKDQNRFFHQLKHELIEQNPKVLKNETTEEEDAA